MSRSKPLGKTVSDKHLAKFVLLKIIHKNTSIKTQKA